MTSTLSNLYVERASSEHPLAIWMLNEQVDYISQIEEENRPIELFKNWSVTNGEAISYSSAEARSPFLNSSTSKILGAVPENFIDAQDDTANITLTGKFDFADNFTPELFNFNIGLYVYLQTNLSNTISIGYKYTLDGETVEVLSTKNTTSRYVENWIFVSDTFDLPPSGATNIRLLIKLNVSEGGIADDSENQVVGSYNFLVNGLTIGQWSEDYNKTSFGIKTNPIPANIALPLDLRSLPAFPYGTSGENAYYLSTEKLLSAKNFGVPLVFGSSNVTQITKNVKDNVNYPSLIFPGYGFLNNRGRNNKYTIEMWVRINSESYQSRKIFGPIASNDGLYVDGAFLTLKIGTSLGSHFVGDWYRPMLIHIRVIDGSATLVLNGEEVISLAIDQDSIALPEEFNNVGKSQDWLGFYAYDDVSPIDIDTFSIYSYAMPTVITKKRWVWGQAVSAPEQANSPLNSVTAFNDYAFSNYVSNYNYPDFASWKQAYFSNVNAESKTLSLPQYALPAFRLGSRSIPELFDDIKVNIGALTPSTSDQDDRLKRTYITLSPNTTWESSSDHIYFNNFGILNEPVRTFYGIFKTAGTEQNKVLIKIVNKNNNNSFSILINNLVVTYQITINGTTQTIATKSINANEKFSVGLDLSRLSSSQNTSLSRFFTSQSSLEMYIAGDGVSKFTGKIYKVGLNSSYNSRKILWMYDDDGLMNPQVNYTITGSTYVDQKITFTTTVKHNYLIGDSININATNNALDLNEQEIISTTEKTFTIANSGTTAYPFGTIATDSSNILYSHTANYTLTAIDKYNLYFPDIAVAGYWEDYQPLSYFSKLITNYDLSSNYELDMIQYNQDFPEPPKVESTIETSEWYYENLRLEYLEPVLLSYADLNNDFYTGWRNYQEMSDNSVRTNFYETKDSNLRSYVSFQKIKDGANRSLADFHSFAKPLTSGIIDPSEVSLDWEQTAFETTTGTLIYPPTQKYTTKRSINFEDYAIVYHLDFKSEGILHQPIRFKELQLASQVYETTDFTPVGSRFGIPVYYYSKSGIYFDFKAKNPIATYKKSTPYLYLDRHSGWKLKGKFEPTIDRGIAIPVNLAGSDDIEVASMQLWIRFAEEEFPEEAIMIFSIEHNEGTYDFFIQSDGSRRRGSIFAVDRDTTEVIETIEYYVNGESVSRPYLNQKEWSMLGLQFGKLLDFSNQTGLINLNGPLIYNNVSYNLATNIEKNKTIETRTWSDILKTKDANITNAVISGNDVIYTAANTLQVGDLAIISGIIPAEFNNVGVLVKSRTPTSFVVEKNEGLTNQTYESGGLVEFGDWRDLPIVFKTPGVRNEPDIAGTWNKTRVIVENLVFSVDPKAIYERYTGSNRIVIEDNVSSPGLLVDPERIRVYKDVSWSDRLKIPV